MNARIALSRALAAAVGLFWRVLAHASETGGALPWNAPLDTLKENITGPTVTVFMILALVLGFAIWTLSDDNRGLFRVFKAVIAMAVISTIGVFFGSLGISAAVV